jgi:DNA-binding transcriptional regulator YiaG
MYAIPIGYRNGTSLVHAITVTLFMGVGTGGECTTGYLEARDQRAAFSKSRENVATTDADSPISTEIEHIKATLQISMRELADCLGVSRQAPYNWMAGSKIKSDNLAKLNNLKAAADVIALAKLPAHPLFLQRKISEGRSLLEAVAAGADGASAAESLVEIFRHEETQRKMLTQLIPSKQQRQRALLPKAET